MCLTKQLLRVICSVFLLVITRYDVFAQTCTPTFHKLYYGTGNDESFDVRATSDKGSIVTGRTSSNSAQYDGFLMKLDEQGNIEWSKTYGGSEYDDLLKVRQTSDGGYVAIGVTKSFGEPHGETWVIKTDANGILQWSQHYKKNSDPVKAKSIVQLTDGSYLFAVNINDSTKNGDGMIVRINSSGIPVWSLVFDNGDDDGINVLEEDGDTFLMGGYATVNERKGILMRMRVSDASIVWCRKFTMAAGRNDEIIHVEKINGGLAFAASSTYPVAIGGYSPYLLTLFKTRGDSNIFFKRRVDAHINYKIASVHVRTTPDSGFIYASNDTVPAGQAQYHKVAPTGMWDWGHLANNDWERRRLEGLDVFSDKGYILSGYVTSFQYGNRNRIQVLKTDIMGETGSCDRRLQTNFIDTANYTISGFTWNSIAAESITNSSEIVQEILLPLSTQTLCADTYCEIPDVPKGVSCYSTLITHLKGKYGFTPFDELRVEDGYILVGYQTYFRGADPVVLKLRLDGTVAWTKTLTRYVFSNDFNKVLLASDGNVIITGKTYNSSYYENDIGSFILKLSPSDGSIIWSKTISGNIVELTTADNGTLIGCIVRPEFVTLFKIDLSGNIVWQRTTNGEYDSKFTYRSLVHDGNSIYAAGEYESDHRVTIEKLDLDGNSVWLKSFKINGYDTWVESLHLIGDSLYFDAEYYDMVANPIFGERKLAMVKISKDGGSLSGFTLNDLGLVSDGHYFYYFGSRFHIVTRTIDDNFVVAELTGKGKDTALVLTKFSPVTGQIFWSRKYDNLNKIFVSRIKDDGGSLMILGRKFLHSNDVVNIYQAIFMRTDPVGQVSKDGVGDCHNLLNEVRVVPITFTELTKPLPVRSAGSAVVKPYDVITRYFTVNSQVGCTEIKNCSSIQISGPTIVCNANGPITFLGKRDVGCTNPVLWKIDNTSVTMVSQTDSSITVQFRNAGNIPLVAYLSTTCGVVKDSVNITVSQISNLHLGNDTTICPGNSILVNAHKGFASYEWQDGSTDSFFRVTKPEKYFVTVTDGCGSTLSDTIVISQHVPAPFSVGVDRTTCNSDTVHVNAPTGFANYSWSPSYNINSTESQKIVVNPAVDTAYFVRAEDIPGCFVYDTIRIKVNHSPTISLGRDTSFCFGKSTVLDAGAGFTTYRWSDGSSFQTITVNKVGTFSVIGTTAEGCSSYDTMKVISVYPLPVITLDHNQELCESSTRSLDPGTFSSFLWQDGNTNRRYTVNTSGTYYVQVTDNNGCTNSDTVHITTMLPSPSHFLPNDTSICSYGTAELKTVSSFNSYLWSNGSTLSKITIDKAGNYWLQVKDSKGCIGRDTIVVTLKDCMKGVYIPTAFTPNQDSKNDQFRAMLFGKVKSFDLTIYNRWGQAVFHTTDYYKGWDGKVAGKEQDPGTFIWLCRYQLEGDQEKVERGTVTLIR